MGTNKVKKYGNFYYVEPNDFLEEKLYGNKKDNFNITYPYEDYCISVDLIVNKPNRFGQINSNEENYKLGYDSRPSGEKISFLSGVDDFLTDSPGTVIYHDILNKNSKECLGINSIDITFNSYYVPQVTINFTDVRGGALMMPQEENYRREYINKFNEKAVYEKGVESLFSSLFSFPPSEFTLRVKGFYGKKVDFTLNVASVYSKFNEQTGNFEIIVKFIGNMFGIYNDIPMLYLLIAPYCKYGGYNNLTIWEQNNFKFKDETPIPTLIDLNKKILNAKNEIDKNLNYNIVGRYKELELANKKILEINSEYNILIKSLKNINDDRIFVSSDDNLIILTYYKNTNSNIEFNEENFKINYLNDPSPLFADIKHHIDILSEKIDDYNKNNNGSLTFLFSYNKDKKKVLVNENDIFNVALKSDKIIFSNDKKNFELNSYYYSEFKNFLSKKISPIINKNYNNLIQNFISTEECYVIINSNDFSKSIDDIMKSNKTKLEDIDKELDNNINVTLVKLIGFDPTIENIFRIIMAHFQTFIQIYKGFLDNISNSNQRTLNEYGLSLDNTDIRINTNKNEDAVFPAFPYIKDLTNNTYCYPKYPIITKPMEETKLIDSIFDSLIDFDKNNFVDITDVSNKETFIPTCLTDIIFNVNPYQIDFNNSIFMGIDWIFTYLGIRWIQKYIFEQSDLNPEVFGKCEAYNFWSKNKKLDRTILNSLNSNQYDSNKFVSFLNGDNVKYLNLTNNGKKSCYETKTIKKIINIIESGDDKKIELSYLFNYPAVIGRTNDNIWKIFNDDTDDSNVGEYSFSKDNSKYMRPMSCIKFIEEDDVDFWKNYLENFKYKDYCNEIEWNNFFKKYISSTKDIFKKSENHLSTDVWYINNEKLKSYSFIELFKSEKNLKNSFEIKKINNFYDNDFKDLKIFDIKKRTDGSNIFLKNNLEPEDFLCLNYNFETISNEIKKGNTILTMPYALQLFLGMIMYNLKNDEFNNFFSKLKSIYTNPKELFYIGYIINCLTRNNNKEFEIIFNIDSYEYGYEEIDTYAVIENKFKSLKEKGFLNKDYLGLINLYKKWVTSNDDISFNYFKDKFTLKVDEKYFENLRNENNNIEYIKNLDINNVDDYIKAILELIKNDIKNNKKTDEDIKEIFDESLTLVNDNKITFSEIFSNIFFIPERTWRTNIFVLNFNDNYKPYQKLYEFFRLNSKLVIPYTMIPQNVNNNASLFKQRKKSELEKCFYSFKKQLFELYNNENNTSNEETALNNVNEDGKLSLYNTLKILHDKHFYKFENNDNEYNKYIMFNNDGSIKKGSEFDRFKFIDHLLNDIGGEDDGVRVNLDILSNIIRQVTDGLIVSDITLKHQNMSLFTFITKICESCKLLFLTLPFLNGFRKETISENIEDMFTPFSYNDSLGKESLSGPCFACFYPNKGSEHLDDENSDYQDDGFDINDTGNHKSGLVNLNDLKEHDLCVPSFAVDFGKQSQSVFKNVSVSMDNPQVTEASVAIQFELVKNNNNDTRNISFEGQELYQTYSNYSYQCSVEMMGCAQISPLMYFQLNNIPMFRGAYIIYNVEHKITPGNMITLFKGSRIDKTKMPINHNCISISSIKPTLLSKNINEINRPKINRQIQISLPDNNSLMNMIGDEDWLCSSDDLLNSNDIRIEFGEEQKDKFNMLNPCLRQLIYCIGQDIYKTKGYGNLTLYITSTVRDAKNNTDKSDHTINGSPSERRKKLKGKNGYGEEKYYSEMGCAVDMYIKKNGKPVKGDETIYLFKLIVIKYHEYIRQLIWETKKFDSLSLGVIDNVIHLSSYGKKGENGTDKTEIFASSRDMNFSGRTAGYNNLSNEFLLTINELINNKNTNYVKYPNFVDNKNNLLNTDEIEKFIKTKIA